ncbi:MAG: electron transfer flavoprotein-ubiquinone oxidoreductase [Pseudomonadota bacterium]|nr:electron transfer flavoprotein-ubiquinone oxidoreductase [Pseudomonadota bacterium]
MTEAMEYDVVIVGAGPAGLAAAIRLRQLSQDISVCILEKGSEVGAHILSGAVLEPRALSELIPDWKEKGAPVTQAVTEDRFLLLTKKHALRLPTPPQMKNHGNYIISLGNLCRWLGQEAESIGVQIFPGFPAADLLIENGRVAGVITGEFGRAKDGHEKPGYQPGIAVKGKYTLFAEGCRGSLSERLMKEFGLRDGVSPQTYGIGIKELWEIDPAKHKPGLVIHSFGWPLDSKTYGGSFLYHNAASQIAVGFVIGLDYENPHLDPFMEFQRFKTHPAIAPYFEDGKRICYGARAINEGGFQSIPKLTFPGGALIGCAAGFVNVPKVKGSHNAMKSGMLAAEAIAASALESYPEKLKSSWIHDELYKVRNIRPAFHKGLIPGLLYAAVDTFLFRGRAPWTFRNHADHLQLRKTSQSPKISYSRPDGKLTFDRMSSVFLSATNHEEDQPCHLKLKNPEVPVEINLPQYDAPEQRYCPAGVYEIVREANSPRLQINAPNCVHCKTCDIKDPTQNIVWTTPEGGGGPNYSGM